MDCASGKSNRNRQKEAPVDNRGFVKGFRCAGYTM